MDLSQTSGCDPSCTLDFFVENLGRVNFGKFKELSFIIAD